jgi:hypothetical protein
MRKNILSAFLLLCFTISFFLLSCSGKEQINTEMLEIETEAVAYNEGWNFTVRADKLGALPVTEYGILHLSFSRGSTDRDYVPRIERGARVRFDKPLAVGLNTYKYIGNDFAGKYFYYYRAYAIKSDGSVVYGEVKNYTFP